MLPPAIAVNAEEGLTHKALAKKIGASESTVRNWGTKEYGQKTPPESKGNAIPAHAYDPSKKRWFPA